jgi:hypothetical protein
MMDYRHKRAKGRRTVSILVALGVVAIIAASLVFYPRPPTSNTVYCGILQYAEFPALSITGGQTITATHTLTTMIDYTTTTNVAGPLGRTVSNSTTSTNTSGYSAGVETICKYISSVSTTT